MKTERSREDAWLLWLMGPFACLGFILLALSAVSLVVGPLPYLPKSLLGAGP
jgi:hypothetical protein